MAAVAAVVAATTTTTTTSPLPVCSYCSSERVLYTCKCGGPVYCTQRCQARHWVAPGSGGHHRTCEAALVVPGGPVGVRSPYIGAAASPSTNDKDVRRSNRPNNRNVFEALNSGDAELVSEVQQELQPFDIYVRLIERTPFWRENIDTQNQYTVFAPDNGAMIAWLRTLGLARFLQQAVVIGGSSVLPVDLAKTVDAFYALDAERLARAHTVLLAHFIPKVRPLFTGLERGPRPIDRVAPVQRRGLSPLTALGVDTEWDPVWAALPDERFFRARYRQLRVAKNSNRGKPLRRGGGSSPLKAGFTVRFLAGGGADAEIVNDEAYILRPRNGYVYRIGEVLGRNIDPPTRAELATLPKDLVTAAEKREAAAAAAATGAATTTRTNEQSASGEDPESAAE